MIFDKIEFNFRSSISDFSSGFKTKPWISIEISDSKIIFADTIDIHGVFYFVENPWLYAFFQIKNIGLKKRPRKTRRLYDKAKDNNIIQAYLNEEE